MEKDLKEIESYFQTENEHWNEYTFITIRKVLSKELFSNLKEFLELYEESIDIASQSHRKQPFQGLQLIISKCEAVEYSTEQIIFLLDRVHEYLDKTEFEGWYSSEIQELIKSKLIFLNNELNNKQPEYNKPLTVTIRDTLKDFMQTELEQLTENIKKLDAPERMNVLCKLMPYVLPKTENIKHTLGEPQPPKKDWY